MPLGSTDVRMGWDVEVLSKMPDGNMEALTVYKIQETPDFRTGRRLLRIIVNQPLTPISNSEPLK